MDDLQDTLRRAAELIRTPERLDAAVLAAARAAPPRQGHRILPVAALGLAACLLAVPLLPRAAAEYECRNTLSALTRAVESRDIPKAVGLCAADPEAASRLAERLGRFYERYPDVRYELRNVRVRTRGRSALATAEYRLVASGQEGELRLSGTDRLYLERGPDGRFRIHHWIDS